MDKAKSGGLTLRTLILLGLMLLCGGTARFSGIAWDQWTSQHPDERHVTMSVGRLSWPESWAQYFNESESPLNPRNRDTHFFAYGTLPGTMLRGIVDLGGIEKPEHLIFTGRFLAALADTLVIGLIFLTAWTLYRRQELALLASAFYAAAVVPIQHAHFFVVDPFANFFVALALWTLARAWRHASWLDYVWTGIALGLAVSCKISVGTVGLPVALVALLPSPGRATIGETLGMKLLWRGCIGTIKTILFVVSTVLTVRLALPDAFIGSWELAPRWLSNMREVIGISTGATDIVFTRQFYGRTPLVWPWWNMVVWGLGLLLGLAAWIAWGFAAMRLFTHRIWAHAVPVLVVATVFFHQGFTYQSTLRYFLPIYGSLCILAAWGLTALSGSKEAWFRWIGRAVTCLVLLFTVGWALGFLSIYSRPHTRIEASKWIFKNVPAGSTLALEHWDDWIPLGLPGEPSPELYRQIELPLYDVDEPEKRGQLLAKLSEADYIILASQKLRDSIPRMPHRYPFSVSYYEGLEDGSLGFDKVAEFTRSIQFFGVPISTRSAEEAFSVYDHPPVVIYKKAERFDPDVLMERFDSIALEGVTDTRGPVATILLSPERWEAAQSEGTWSEMFKRVSVSSKFPLVVWVALLVLLQAIGWGIIGPVLGGLPDRGAAFGRLFGLLFAAWLIWLGASCGLLRFTRGTIWMVLILLSLLSTLCVLRSLPAWKKWWETGRGTFCRVELTFWVGFLAFVGIRALNPDLWHIAWGGEKPMEMAYLYGVLRSEEFPPMNPWFAGGFINYYYFGFVLCGTMIKALGVLPEVGFNLCLATFYGFSCAAALSAARALKPGLSWFGAWCAPVFVMVIGNLFQIRFIWGNLVRLGAETHQLTFPIVSDVIRAVHGVSNVRQGVPLSPYPESDLYWVAARAIGGEEVAPITEFPFWSFLYADLHPHLMALPYTLAIIALCVAWVGAESWHVKLGLNALFALTLGFFWPTNTWDWPTYGALTGLVMFLTAWRDERKSPAGFARAGIKSVVGFVLILTAGYFAFLPYYQHFVSGYGTFKKWEGNRTTLVDYLFIHGFFLFVLGTAFISSWRADRFAFSRGMRLWIGFVRSFIQQRYLRLVWRNPLSFLGAMFALLWLAGLAHGLWHRSLVTLLACGVVISLFAIWQRRKEPVQAIPVLLILIALVLSIVVELVVLVGDVGRMNTVFKFYYQVWVCYALASAVVLPDILKLTRAWKLSARFGWIAALLGLLGLSLLYPLTATPTKINDRFVRTAPTLDGLVFAKEGMYEINENRFPLAPDLAAIRWLQDNIEGSPVLLEMNLGDILYAWGSRYSIHTGLPSVVGWNWHQRQQQAGLARNQVEERIADVKQLYRSPEETKAWELLRKYGIRLIVVGELERLYGTPEGLEKFERMGLETLYDADGVKLYQVP